MKKTFSLIVITLCMISCQVFAAEIQDVKTIKIDFKELRGFYPYINAVSNGPEFNTEGRLGKKTRGISYRVTTLLQNSSYTVMLDEFVVGKEGDLSYLSSRLLKLHASGFSFKGGEFKVIQWNSPISFDFEIDGKRYRLDNIDTDTIKRIDL